jgi:hypothetical protein
MRSLQQLVGNRLNAINRLSLMHELSQHGSYPETSFEKLAGLVSRSRPVFTNVSAPTGTIYMECHLMRTGISLNAGSGLLARRTEPSLDVSIETIGAPRVGGKGSSVRG